MKEADGPDGEDAPGHPNPVKDEPDGSLRRISLTSPDPIPPSPSPSAHLIAFSANDQ